MRLLFMTRRSSVKVLRHATLFAALSLGCGGARVALAVAEHQRAETPVGDDAGAAPAPRAHAQTLTAPTTAEVDALRPLLDRGPVFVVRNPDAGADARITILTRAQATAAQMRHVITTPAEYGSFMPILRSVDVITTHGARTAFRFHVAAPLFDVTALCAMNDLSERRVDVAITQSETGPGGSRWDLTPESDSTSLVSLSTWGDPSQGHWILRQVARRSPSAIAGMNISVDTVLALGAARRAAILAGRDLPVRPAQGIAPAGDLAPPPSGAWQALTRDASVLSMALTPEGSIRQVTVASWTSAPPSAVMARLRDVANYTNVWGSVREVSVLPGQPSSPDGPVRYHIVIDTPLTHLEGEQVMRVEGDHIVWHEGVAGDLVDSAHRWDVLPAPDGGSYVLLTGGSDYNRAGWVTRTLMERDPWLMAGFAGSWKIVWIRHLLRGL